MANRLVNYIRNLYSRGKNVREIWQSIKKHRVHKFNANVNIINAMNQVQDIKKALNSFEKLADWRKVGKSHMTESVDKPSSVQIGVEFTFTTDERPGGKRGKSPVRYLLFDCPAGLTKGEMMRCIKDKIRQWINQYYEGRNLRGVANSIKVIDMKGL